ncbi:MAG: hypothetical protein GF416_08265 [Candidatus Altiarchaeales archaeon]|nr:hypothetical protein [Candidatus Altiarchaeales archaeon]MBD3417109.1 hypothetical protein [Candidatus Altiarchaeales archaeon]
MDVFKRRMEDNPPEVQGMARRIVETGKPEQMGLFSYEKDIAERGGKLGIPSEVLNSMVVVGKSSDSETGTNTYTIVTNLNRVKRDEIEGFFTNQGNNEKGNPRNKINIVPNERLPGEGERNLEMKLFLLMQSDGKYPKGI